MSLLICNKFCCLQEPQTRLVVLQCCDLCVSYCHWTLIKSHKRERRLALNSCWMQKKHLLKCCSDTLRLRFEWDSGLIGSLAIRSWEPNRAVVVWDSNLESRLKTRFELKMPQDEDVPQTPRSTVFQKPCNCTLKHCVSPFGKPINCRQIQVTQWKCAEHSVAHKKARRIDEICAMNKSHCVLRECLWQVQPVLPFGCCLCLLWSYLAFMCSFMTFYASPKMWMLSASVEWQQHLRTTWCMKYIQWANNFTQVTSHVSFQTKKFCGFQVNTRFLCVCELMVKVHCVLPVVASILVLSFTKWRGLNCVFVTFSLCGYQYVSGALVTSLLPIVVLSLEDAAFQVMRKFRVILHCTEMLKDNQTLVWQARWMCLLKREWNWTE